MRAAPKRFPGPVFPIVLTTISLSTVLLFTGCGSGSSGMPVGQPPPVSYTGISFAASVLVGGKPVIGASLALYAAGTAGNGSAATSLIRGDISTDSTGAATIPASYDCPSSNGLVYLTSIGGTVSGGPSDNPNLKLMTTIGPCGSISASSKYTLNEATTVASVVALAQFYKPEAGVGASSTNTTGLTNAFATAATLADPVSGTVPGPTLPANAVSPGRTINSLANALNACAVTIANCSSLYAAVAQGSNLPTNTLDAVYDLMLSPAANVMGVYAASQASSAYTPALSKAPTDWTVFITYSGGGLNTPSGIAIDSTGSVWVANYFSTASKFSPVGVPEFASGITGFGLNDSYGLAIDLSDNVWIANEQPFTRAGIGSVSVLTSAGSSEAGNGGYTAGGFDYPISIAIDPNGTVWVVDYGDSHLTLINPSGQPLSGTSGYSSADLAFPEVVAVDANHFGWVGNLSGTTVVKVAPDGSSFTSYDCCQGAAGLALDAAGNVWVANYYGQSVSTISSAGTIVSNQAYTGDGSLEHPLGIAVDGAENIWVANNLAPYLTELAGQSDAAPGKSLSPATGLGADAQLRDAYGLAIDASGNIWVSNQGNDTITKFIGLAAPVKTPLSGLPKLP